MLYIGCIVYTSVISSLCCISGLTLSFPDIIFNGVSCKCEQEYMELLHENKSSCLVALYTNELYIYTLYTLYILFT